MSDLNYPERLVLGQAKIPHDLMVNQLTDDGRGTNRGCIQSMNLILRLKLTYSLQSLDSTSQQIP